MNKQNDITEYDLDNSYLDVDVEINVVYQYAMEARRDSIKTALLINSGAVIALLAFFGSLTSTCYSNVIGKLTVPLLCYIIGVIFASLSYIRLLCANEYRYRTKLRFNSLISNHNLSNTDAIREKDLQEYLANEKEHTKKFEKFRNISQLFFILGCIVAFFIFVFNF